MLRRALSGSLLSVTAWIVYGFLLSPSLVVVPMSFGNQYELVFPPKTLSLDLYRQFFLTSNWLSTALQSLLVASVSASIALVVGTMAAYGWSRTRMTGKQVIYVVLLSPLLIPAVVNALGLYSYFASIGLVGTTVAIILGHTVYLIPFVIVTVLAGIKELDETVEEAVFVLGAGRLRIFASVVIPQLVPSLLSAVLFSFLLSFDEVVVAWFLSGPTTETLPVKMYSSIQWEVSPVLAAISTMLTVLSVVFCLGAATLTKRRRPLHG